MDQTQVEEKKAEVTSDVAISVKGLYHSYPGTFNPAIEVEEFEIKEGQAVLITGKSGSGKSTLVNCINGVIPHIFPGTADLDPQTHRGEVFVYDMPVSKTPLSKLSTTVGTLLQDPETQVLNYKVEEEVAFGPENLCMSPEEISKRVSEAIDTVGIRHIVQRETYTLSGGELQRVAMAAVLAMRPRILIFDEPTSNIDPEGTAEVFELMRSMRGKTMIVVEHKVERVLPFVDRVVLVDNGRIVFDLEKDKILDHLDELVEAGVEIPNHYLVAKQLGITTTDVDKVILEMKKRGVKLDKPTRFVATENSLEATVKVSYKDNVILDSSVKVGKGEVLAIMGRNGAGKSTMLKALVGFTDRKLNVDLKLNVGGVDLSSSRIQDRGRYIAFVPQNFDLTLVSKTVLEEIAYSPKKHGIKDWRERVSSLMNILSLEEFKDRDPLALSFGQRRRVAMGSALASGARVVMMDEPTSGQDFYHREMLGREISRLKEAGYSFVVVTHDSRFVYRHADRAMILSGGRKVLEGLPEEVFSSSEQYGIPPPTDYLLREE